MRLRLLSTLILLLAATSGQAFAEHNDTVISARLNASGTIKVFHPKALEQRLGNGDTTAVVVSDIANENIETNADKTQPAAEPKAATGKKVAGYRVQVFSDNNPRTAKTEARSKAKELANALPYKTYVVFTAPYWRLRVGDFLSQEEAEVAATRIKRQFPAYASEVRIVRDRVNH